jgi:drug/metabolite transporter (DMT)-like permease
MISFSGVWVKISDVSPIISAFYRVTFGSVFFLIAVLTVTKVKWYGISNFILCIGCGFLFALDLFFWHISIIYIGPGLATILANFQVFILALLGILFFGEKINFYFLLSIPMAVLGLFMIIGIHWNIFEQTYRTGIYYGLITAVCYATFILLLRKLQSDLKEMPVYYVLMVVSVTSSLFLFFEIVRVGESLVIPNIHSCIVLIALGLLSQTVSWSIITKSLPHINVSIAGVVLLLQPTLAFVWDVIFFQRKTALMNWVGVIIVLSGIFLSTVNRDKTKK